MENIAISIQLLTSAFVIFITTKYHCLLLDAVIFENFHNLIFNNRLLQKKRLFNKSVSHTHGKEMSKKKERNWLYSLSRVENVTNHKFLLPKRASKSNSKYHDEPPSEKKLFQAWDEAEGNKKWMERNHNLIRIPHHIILL